MTDSIAAKRLARAEKRVAVLEKLIEDKSRELFFKNETLHNLNERMSKVQRAMPGALVVGDPAGAIESANDATIQLIGIPEEALVGCPVTALWKDSGKAEHHLRRARETPLLRTEEVWITAAGDDLPMLVSSTVMTTGSDQTIMCVGVDLRERKRLELDLRQAQKLEAIGQLAAGIAHEINTPMQFIGDNVHFLSDVFGDLLAVIDVYERIRANGKMNSALRDELADALENADLEYVSERGPRAIERTLVGIERVAAIVQGMKTFAHPATEKSLVDINKAVQTTLVVARHEYRYLADAFTDLGELPMVKCHGGELNQVLLNLVVNAAHAIEENRKEGEMGRISIKTSVDGSHVVIRVSDTGGGIPEEIRHRIFDPFFTTKAVGKGSGQGLALAHAVIVDKHGGIIDVDSKPGRGTAFTLRLPIAGEAKSLSEAS